MSFKDFDFSVILEQILRLKHLISQPDTDVLWSSYNSADEVIKKLESIEAGIKSRDISALDKIHFMLLPTGDLQEISISSGWGHEFLKIAETVDNALLEIGAAMKKYHGKQKKGEK